jgi:acyl-coenzyme A synthetase/AMP-(fatty) acid ligase
MLVLPGARPALAAVVVPSAAGWRQIAESGRFWFSRLLRRVLAAAQGPAGLPRRWRFVASLPTAGIGKRSEANLQALFADPT